MVLRLVFKNEIIILVKNLGFYYIFLTEIIKIVSC